MLLGAFGALLGFGPFACQFPDYDLPDGEAGQGGLAAAGAGSGPVAAAGGVGADGNAGGGGAGGVGGTSPPPLPCGIGKACTPGVPAGWLGPVAYWQAKVGHERVPDCSDGYVDPNDLNTGLLAPDAECTCTCTGSGEICDKGASVSVYSDLGCKNKCLEASPLTCTGISGCNGNQGSLLASPPAPSGGKCKAQVTSKPLEPISWEYEARLCSLETAEMGSCTEPGELCVPTPPNPFASQLCVFRVVPEGQEPPECPAAYPHARDALYSSFDDERACSTCTCSGPTGGRCDGKLTLSSGPDCSSGFEYTLGSGCQQFGLGTQPAQLDGEYALVKGTCGIASDVEPTGGATPSGSATIVCCL